MISSVPARFSPPAAPADAHIFTGQLRQLLPGLSEGIVNELLLAGEELLPAGAVGAALGSPLILLGITGGLFLIRRAAAGPGPRTSP